MPFFKEGGEVIHIAVNVLDGHGDFVMGGHDGDVIRVADHFDARRCRRKLLKVGVEQCRRND